MSDGGQAVLRPGSFSASLISYRNPSTWGTSAGVHNSFTLTDLESAQEDRLSSYPVPPPPPSNDMHTQTHARTHAHLH